MPSKKVDCSMVVCMDTPAYSIVKPPALSTSPGIEVRGSSSLSTKSFVLSLNHDLSQSSVLVFFNLSSGSLLMFFSGLLHV